MKKSKIMIALLIVALIAGAAFNFLPSNKAEVSETEEIEKVQPVGPDFNADSAYIYLQEQCDFGPRTMNSVAHDKCEKWIIQKFEQYGTHLPKMPAAAIFADRVYQDLTGRLLTWYLQAKPEDRERLLPENRRLIERQVLAERGYTRHPERG